MANINNVKTGNVNIPGALHSTAADGYSLVGNVVAYAGDIYDTLFSDGVNTGMNQAAINAYLKTNSGTTYTHPVSHPASMITYNSSTEYESGNVGYAIKALQTAIAGVPTYSAGTGISISNNTISVNASQIDYEDLLNILVRNVDYQGVSINGGGSILNGESNVVMGARSSVVDGYGTIAAGYFAIANGWGAFATGSFTYAVGTGAHVEGKGLFDSLAVVHRTMTVGTSVIVDHEYPVGAMILNLDYDKVQSRVTDCQPWSEDSRYYVLTLSSPLEELWSPGTRLIIIGYAAGIGAHAEGIGTIAEGDGAHAEGMYTVTSNKAEHASGLYNKSTKLLYYTGNPTPYSYGTLFSVGIGSSYQDRANAFEILGNGLIYIKGVGNYDGTNAGQNGVLSLQDMLSSLGFGNTSNSSGSDPYGSDPYESDPYGSDPYGGGY